MAHQIESIAFANEVPWHGLGARLDDSATPDEFLKAAGLDWTVDLKPLKADIGDGEMIDVPGRFALVRNTDKRIMTVTGSSWRPLQNRDTLDFMTKYCTAGGAKMETAGSLRNGSIVWGLAKLGHSFAVRPNDRVEGYLLITSPHQVGQAITIRTTTVRVVCANTMALAERGGEVNYRQNHLSDFDVESARAAVENAHEQLAACERRAKILDALKLTTVDTVAKVLLPVFDPDLIKGFEDEEVNRMATEMLETNTLPKQLTAILESVNNAPGAIPDSGWGVLNGVTHWADHSFGRDSATRMFRSWIGDHSRKKIEVEQRLFDLAA